MSDESRKRQLETNIAKYGSYEAYRAEMKRRAIKGGKNSSGSFKDREFARKAGRLGGIAKAKKLKEDQ